MLYEFVQGKNCVVGFDHGVGQVWGGKEVEADLDCLAVVHRQLFLDKRAHPRPGPPSEGLVDAEPLEPRTGLDLLADVVQHHLYQLFADCVVSPAEVIGSIFLPRYQTAKVEHLLEGTGPHLIDR